MRRIAARALFVARRIAATALYVMRRIEARALFVAGRVAAAAPFVAGRVAAAAPFVARRVAARAVCLALALCIALALLPAPVRCEPAPGRIAALARGVSLTGWFRFPASADPAALRAWLGDTAMADLRRLGFTFVRLAVQPEFVGDDPRRQAALIEAIRRLQHQGLAVVIDMHPSGWNLDQPAPDRRALLDFWRRLAPALRGLPPGLTFPELLNEPVFAGQDAAWQALQHTALDIVRAALPADTVVLTGDDWGSVAGLLRLRPEADPNVIYSFHLYDPAELTSLAAYRPDVRHADMARLPFPVDDQAACRQVADASPDAATAGLMRFYCSLGWNGARIAARVDAAAEWGRRNHAAVWLGEFGASARLNLPARLAWLRAVREACAGRGIGWALWGYDDVMGFGVPRPPGPHPILDRGVLRALGIGAPG